MQNRYDISESDDGLAYQFIADSGNVYTAYFTQFFLTKEDGAEIEVFSFGFSCKTAIGYSKKFDAKIRGTIQFIIKEFFYKNAEEAVLYICLIEDGKARNRHITFSNWFADFGDGFSKHDSDVKYAPYNFYSSLIISNKNPDKDVFVNAFYYTIDYWLGE